MGKTNPDVDACFTGAGRWREVMERLRSIVLSRDLTEELKWRQACYTHGGKNVAIISEFNDYCVLSFFKGSLLSDPHGVLTAPGEHSQATRQFRFTSVDQVTEREAVITAYLDEAIEVERSGATVPFKTTEEFELPDELQARLEDDPEFKSAFDALTPGRQRGYILHFSQPKQSKTRSARIEKHAQRILEGKGLRDR